jgi:quercetin dioxygenase-like cupin family protein
MEAMELERWNPERDGPLSEDALRRKLEAEGYQVSRYVYPPGTHFPDHSHGVEKKDAVVSGRFRIILEGAEVTLEAGDCVRVPRGALHNATVVGREAVVSLDAVKVR